MAANTGPDINTYALPEVALGDTFNTWRDVTNTGVYKLNKIRIYDGVSSSSIDITVAAGGTMSVAIADNVNKGVTFIQPVVFQSGVTFNGDVTFNASTFTVNANVVTIDDYALVLGNTAAGSSDAKINAAGGGGLLIERGGGNTAEWLWKTTNLHGLTGVWQANAHIGISGATFGIYPNAGGILPVHGTGIGLDGGSTSDHGLLVELTSSGDAGTTSNRSIQFERYSPAGSTVFMEIFSGTTYGARPFVNISDGANRKTVYKAGHTFVFGQVLRFDGSDYQLAQASDADSAEVIGVVSKTTADTFEITFLGEIFGDFSGSIVTGSSTLTAGRTYYLAPDSAGKITPVQPTSPGQVHKAILVSTGTNSAIVLPFTGGVLQSPIQIANSSSVATRINQLNKFVAGDVVRFKAYSTGVTLEYYLPTPGVTAKQYFADGVYVKAQANTSEEAEIAGMVIAVGVSGEVNTSFDVLMDGFFNFSSPIYSTNLVPGTVYFLAKNCAGTTGSFESAVMPLTTTPPSDEGQVRKPMLMATSALSGYLFSYRGDVRGAALGVSYANLANFLVSDINDGISGDLKIGVYNGSSNGREAVRLAAGQGSFTSSVGVTGYVGVGGGWQALNTGNGNRILTQLDVRGDVRVGATLSSLATPQGRDLIVSRYNTDDISSNGTTAATFNVIGTRYGNSNLAIGHGVRSAVGSDAWISSTPSSTNIARSALVVGVSGSEPSLVWKTAASSAVGLGTAVAMTDRFAIIGNTAAFVGAVNIGTTVDRASLQTHKTRLFIQGDSNTSPRSQVYMTTTDGNFLLMNSSGQAGDYNTINQYNGGSYLVFGKQSGGGAGHTFAIAPWSIASQQAGMLMSYDGTSVNVGINTYNPTETFDVNGTVRIRGGGGNSTGLLSYLDEGSRLVASDSTGTLKYVSPYATENVAVVQIYTANTGWVQNPATSTSASTGSLTSHYVYSGNYATLRRGVYMVFPYDNLTYVATVTSTASYYGRFGIFGVNYDVYETASGLVRAATGHTILSSSTTNLSSNALPGINFTWGAATLYGSNTPYFYDTPPFMMWVPQDNTVVRGYLAHAYRMNGTTKTDNTFTLPSLSIGIGFNMIKIG